MSSVRLSALSGLLPGVVASTSFLLEVFTASCRTLPEIAVVVVVVEFVAVVTSVTVLAESLDDDDAKEVNGRVDDFNAGGTEKQ
jgi:hypothetical protein